MGVKDESARTMRIDIEPHSMSETDRIEAVRSWTVYGSEDGAPVSGHHRLRSRSSDYEKLLQSVYDGVLITDPRGQITDFNDRALDFYRCDAEHLMGTLVIKLISGADSALLEAVRANLKNHRYTLIEARCMRYDNSLFPAEIAVNKVDLHQEGDMCFFVRDISIRKQAQEALEDAVARLEKHDAARSEFISNVSHELRTPLTSMIYAISNMLRGVVGPLSGRVKDYLTMLDGDCKRLLGTVNDILDIRKVEDDALELDRSKFPIAPLVRDCAESLEVQARRKGIVIEEKWEDEKWFIEADARRIERVLLNVLGNAVKFTSDGGSVHIAVGADPSRDGYVEIQVRDTGIGIPPEAISKVMLRYFTVGEQPSGSGLGLAISKEIVELHGGLLDIESPPAGFSTGTRVSIRLPTIEPPRVLIVDDDPAVCEFLQRHVEVRGYRGYTAVPGEDTFERVDEVCPDVLVLDVQSRAFDGLEFLLKVRHDERRKAMGIIGLTSSPLGKARDEIFKALEITILRKPLDGMQFVERLAEMFMGSKESVGLSVQQPDASR